MGSAAPRTLPASAELAPRGPALGTFQWTPDRPVDDVETVGEAFEALALRLVQGRSSVLFERLYVRPEAAERAVELRAEVFVRFGLDPAMPITLVVNQPCDGGLCAGLQAFVVDRPGLSSARVCSVDDDGTIVGRVVEQDGTRFLFLTNLVSPTASADAVGELFVRADRLLRAEGFTFEQVVRTWFHVDELLADYQSLNSSRGAFFDRLGIGQLPASTGIQGRHPTGAGVFLDLIAVDGVPWRPLRPPMQAEAWSYGSSFSRAAEVRAGGRVLLTVSGTASIDEQGRTVHIGDSKAQILETLRHVDGLARVGGLDPGSACHAILYFKDQATWQAWGELPVDRRAAMEPSIKIFGEVCRDDLLFEAELTAIQ